jgi:hypothetical protein
VVFDALSVLLALVQEVQATLLGAVIGGATHRPPAHAELLGTHVVSETVGHSATSETGHKDIQRLENSSVREAGCGNAGGNDGAAVATISTFYWFQL